MEGLSAPEVAEVLGVSESAVKSRLHRARAAVRAQLAPLLGIPSSDPSPTCPDVITLYSKHLEGEISSALCTEMEQHVATCERCRRTCDSLKQTLALCSAPPASEVPAEVQAMVKAALRQLVARRPPPARRPLP
jgi:RNA polymerase sigma-70 factor (ECF subfamily)